MTAMSKPVSGALALAAAVAAFGWSAPAAQAQAADEAPRATATLLGTDGAEIGTVDAVGATEGVILSVTVEGLTPGVHGMHLHATGACETPDFTSAGGHITGGADAHGLKNPEGPHAGDLGNLMVGAGGVAQVELHAAMVTIADGPTALLDDDGSALVIHEGPDDHVSQPIGGSGARVACGVFRAD
ncbi:MAG: superoxide dismutase family protein [Azospirillaceae bacterium]